MNEYRSDLADSVHSRLTITAPNIFLVDESVGLKHAISIGEIQPASADVCLVFRGIPFVIHNRRTIRYKRIQFNRIPRARRVSGGLKGHLTYPRGWNGRRFAGETEQKMARELADLVGPETRVKIDPRLRY